MTRPRDTVDRTSLLASIGQSELLTHQCEVDGKLVETEFDSARVLGALIDGRGSVVSQDREFEIVFDGHLDLDDPEVLQQLDNFVPINRSDEE